MDGLRAKLAAKKNKVIESVAGIVKTGKNESQRYKYAEETEVVREVRKALVSAGLSFSVSAKDLVKTHDIATRSGSMAHFAISLLCTFTDTETGYAESCEWLGAAADSGDKALYKAFTSGCKYFLMKTFLLPTGDDVEAFSDVDEKPDRPKQKPDVKKEMNEMLDAPQEHAHGLNEKQLDFCNRVKVILEENSDGKEVNYQTVKSLIVAMAKKSKTKTVPETFSDDTVNKTAAALVASNYKELFAV